MPNDAKLGMVVGLGLVLAVALFFVRKDYTPAAPTADVSQAAGAAPGADAQPPGIPAGRIAQGEDEEK
jgi:hypothetical protein